MAKSEWEQAQDEFQEKMEAKYGKNLFIHRFPDSKDVSRRQYNNPNKFGPRLTLIPPQPSDFICTLNGDTFYAEVKATSNTKGIYTGLFTQQKNARTRIRAASGRYLYFVKNLNTGIWYKFWIEEVNPNSTWENLQTFIFDI